MSIDDTLPYVTTVQIEPLRMRGEFGNVVRVEMIIVLVVLLYVSATSRPSFSGPRHLLPFQAVIRDRPGVEQRMFRELQEGLLEAEAARAATGDWPAVSSLADQGIPPFARDPTAKGASYTWHLVRAGVSINYIGIPDRADALAWLLLIQEPTPGALPDQAKDDQEHHRLSDGTVLHVSTWNHANGGRVEPRFVRVPQAEGWTQLYAVDPAAPATSK